MEAAAAARELEALLAAMLAASRSLREAVAGERKALEARDPALLEQAANEKLAHSARLEQLERGREAMCRRSGAGGMAGMLAWCDATGRIAHVWSELRETLEACRAANEANGRLLVFQHRHVEQALRVLRGQSEEPEAYDPQGRASHVSTRRAIAKA